MPGNFTDGAEFGTVGRWADGAPSADKPNLPGSAPLLGRCRFPHLRLMSRHWRISHRRLTLGRYQILEPPVGRRLDVRRQRISSRRRKQGRSCISHSQTAQSVGEPAVPKLAPSEIEPTVPDFPPSVELWTRRILEAPVGRCRKLIFFITMVTKDARLSLGGTRGWTNPSLQGVLQLGRSFCHPYAYVWRQSGATLILIFIYH